MKLKTLSICTIILFILSILVYNNENKRGVDLLAGSDYIKGIDINKIQKISLTFGPDEKLVLQRDANHFVLENHKSYPAATEKINDLIYKIANIQVKEKISSNADEDELKKYELDNSKKKYLVEIFDNSGKRTISFRVGRSFKGKGNYLYKEGKKDIYLSADNLWINSSYKDFINTVLLNVNKDEVEKVTLETDKNLEFIKNENGFTVNAQDKNKYKEEKVQEYLNGLSNLRFEEFYSVTEPKYQGLNFTEDIKIKLRNKMIYKISLAKENNEHYVKLAGLLEEAPSQFVVSKDDGKEELQKIEDVIRAQGEVQRLNMEKGAWVYKVNKSVYEKIAKDSKFFL